MEYVEKCENCKHCFDFGVFGCYCENMPGRELNVGKSCELFEIREDINSIDDKSLEVDVDSD